MGKFGVVLPIERGAGGYFRQSSNILEQAKSNILNLLLTIKGERIMQPTYGCNLHVYLFENFSDQLVADIRADILTSVKTWLPYISISDMEITPNELEHAIFITITFSIVNFLTVTETVTFKI